MFVSKSYAIALHIIRLPWGLTMWNRILGFGVFVAAVLFVGPGLIGCGNRENAVGETSLKNRPITSCNPFLKAAGFKLNADATHVGHHGIQCYFDSATGTFVVNILTNDPKEALGKGPPITVDGTTYDTHVVLADIPVQTAGFDGGHSARGANVAAYGTLGWNLNYGGQTVCLSSQHVMTPIGGAGGENVILAGDAGKNATFWQAMPMAPNAPQYYFDLAMATYNNPASANPLMYCSNQQKYPTLLANPGTVIIPDSYHSDGATSGCIGSTLIGRTYGLVNLQGNNYYFAEQLLFQFNNGTSPAAGDSGELMVRNSDNAVVGLLMAKVVISGKVYGIANPLYRANWVIGNPPQPPASPLLATYQSAVAGQPTFLDPNTLRGE